MKTLPKLLILLTTSLLVVSNTACTPAPQEIARKVKESIVKIEVARPITGTKILLTAGTAFSFYTNENGSLLLTAAHNVQNCFSALCMEVFVRAITDAGDKIPVVTVYRDEKYDLAVLFTPRKIKAIEIKEEAPSMFDNTPAFSFGYQYGGKFGPVFTQGRVSSNVFNCPQGNASEVLCMLADLRIGGGASGAPIIEGSGRVIGVLVAYTVKHPYLSIFVVSTSVLRFLKDFKKDALKKKTQPLQVR